MDVLETQNGRWVTTGRYWLQAYKKDFPSSLAIRAFVSGMSSYPHDRPVSATRLIRIFILQIVHIC